MIIKLPITFGYARHKEAKIVQPLTHKDRIKADRLVMVLLFLMTIAGTIIFG